jgi:hypothetical protein
VVEAQTPSTEPSKAKAPHWSAATILAFCLLSNLVPTGAKREHVGWHSVRVKSADSRPVVITEDVRVSNLDVDVEDSRSLIVTRQLSRVKYRLQRESSEDEVRRVWWQNAELKAFPCHKILRNWRLFPEWSRPGFIDRG